MKIYQIYSSEVTANIEMRSEFDLILSATEEPQLLPTDKQLSATEREHERVQGFPIGDITFISYTHTLIVFSESLYSQLLKVTNVNAQWVPIDIEGDRYFLMNMVELVDAIDPDKSVMKHRDLGDGSVRVDPSELVMQEENIGDRWLFRDRFVKSKGIMCSQQFVDWFNEHGFTGVNFKPVYNPAYGMFKISPTIKEILARPDVYGPGGIFPEYVHMFKNHS